MLALFVTTAKADRILFSENYEAGGVPATWTRNGSATTLTIVGDTEGKYISFYLPQENGRSAHCLWGESIFEPVKEGLTEYSVSIDFTAVMLRRDFLIRNKLRFDENCTLGYAEAFIYSVLICNPVIGYADVQLEREKLSGEGGASSPATPSAKWSANRTARITRNSICPSIVWPSASMPTPWPTSN